MPLSTHTPLGLLPFFFFFRLFPLSRIVVPRSIFSSGEATVDEPLVDDRSYKRSITAGGIPWYLLLALFAPPRRSTNLMFLLMERAATRAILFESGSGSVFSPWVSTFGFLGFILFFKILRPSIYREFSTRYSRASLVRSRKLPLTRSRTPKPPMAPRSLVSRKRTIFFHPSNPADRHFLPQNFPVHFELQNHRRYRGVQSRTERSLSSAFS